MRFDFSSPNRIIFGPGVLQEIGSIAKEVGHRALLVQPQIGLDVGSLDSAAGAGRRGIQHPSWYLASRPSAWCRRR